MKQKIVIKVQMRCGKCRKKAMKIAASAEGVISVAVQGSDKDEIVMVGNGVDSAGLCTALRKKLGYANLLSVEEVKPPKPEEKKEEKPKEKKSEEKKPEEKKSEEKKPEEKKEEKEEKKNEKEEGKKSEAAIIYQHCPPYYPPPNYCYPNPPQCYLYTTHYEDNPNCTIM